MRQLVFGVVLCEDVIATLMLAVLITLANGEVLSFYALSTDERHMLHSDLPGPRHVRISNNEEPSRMLDQLVRILGGTLNVSMTQVYRNCSAEIMLGDSSFHRVRACITKSYMPWVSGECRATVVWYRHVSYLDQSSGRGCLGRHCGEPLL